MKEILIKNAEIGQTVWDHKPFIVVSKDATYVHCRYRDVPDMTIRFTLNHLVVVHN